MNSSHFPCRSVCSRWKALASSTLLSVAVVLAAVPNASAQLTIARNFIAPGAMIPGTGQIAGMAPGNMMGGGNLFDIFNAAADTWEAAILDQWTVTINFGWAPQAGFLGVHNLVTQVPVPGVPTRETQGSIRFDNDGSSVWFADPTPLTDEEYRTYTQSSANLGGGVINTGRVLTSPVPGSAAAGRTDLYSVALHEIGHTLGLSSALTSFRQENTDLDVDVVGARPFAGTRIPTISGAHINISSTLMYPSIGTSVRKLPTAADILANAEVSNFNNLNLDPRAASPIPEPATLSLILIGAGVTAAGRFKSRRSHARRKAA